MRKANVRAEVSERKNKAKGKPAKARKPAAKSKVDGSRKAAAKGPAKARAKPGPKPGSAKPPGSGRKAGTPNKRTLELREALEAAGMTDDLHPVVQMFKVYTGAITMPFVGKRWDPDAEMLVDTIEDAPLEPALRVQCMKEVAQYLEPKRKAVDKDGDETDRMEVTLVDSTSYREWLDHPKNPANRGVNKGKA